MAQVLAAHLNLPDVQTFSGGTEATAFHPNAVAALQELGLAIEKIDDTQNPRYRIITGGTKIHDAEKTAVPFTQTEFWGGGIYSHANILDVLNIEPFYAYKTKEVRAQMKKIELGDFKPADIDLFQDLQWAYAKKLVSRPAIESVVITENPDYILYLATASRQKFGQAS